MLTERVIPVAGKGFAKGMDDIRKEFARVIRQPDGTLAIARLFEFIHLTEANAIFQEKLIERGILERPTPDVFHNQSRTWFLETIKDIGPNLKELTVTIPQRISFQCMMNTEEDVSFDFSRDNTVQVDFHQPPAPGYDQYFLLLKIEGSKTGWRYTFEEEFANSQRLVVFVDPALETRTKSIRASNLKMLDRPVMISVPVERSNENKDAFCDCFCCRQPQSRRPGNCPQRDIRLPLTIRGVVLSDSGTDFEALKAAFKAWFLETQTYMSSNAQIELTLKEIDLVIDPGLLDLDSSPCNRGEVSSDLQLLFNKYYGPTIEGEVVAFAVRSLTGSTIGCASHPRGRPGFTVERSIPRYVFAHELGHVLGLTHQDDPRNLMWKTSGFTKIPPMVTEAQIGHMRCSSYI